MSLIRHFTQTNQSRLFQVIKKAGRGKLLFQFLYVVLCMSVPAYANTPVLSPIVNFLLDAPLAIPFNWNGQRITEETRLQSTENAVNILKLDLADSPDGFAGGVQSVVLTVSGPCFKMRGATSEPLVYEWDIITTGEGQCLLELEATLIIDSNPVTLNVSSRLDVIPESGVPQFLDVAEGQEIDLVFNIDAAQKISSGYTGSQTAGSLLPQAYEFHATAPDGESLIGVLYGLLEFDQGNAVLTDDFSSIIENVQMRMKASLKRIHGKFVVVGVALSLPNASPTPGQQAFYDVAWTFLAVPEGTVFTGPDAGRVFHYYGELKMSAVCRNDIVGSLFSVANSAKKTNIKGVLLGKVKDGISCNGLSFTGQAKASMDARVISTHIGPLLASEGFIAPNGDFASAMSSFGLAIAEQIAGSGDIVELQTTANTRVIDAIAAEEFVGFNEQRVALVFKSLKGSLSGLGVGDYVVSRPRPKAPNGFLRKVTLIENVNGFAVVRTEMAYLKDILGDASVHINRSYISADVEEANTWYGVPLGAPAASGLGVAARLREGFSVSSAGKNANSGDLISVTVNKVIFDQDGDHSSKNDQIKVTGNLSFNPSVKIDLECAAFLCSQPDFLAKFVLTEDSSVEVTGSIRKTLTKSYNLPPSIWLPPITAGFLVFTPKFVVQLNVDGSLSASITYTATQSFELEAGVDYTPAAGWGTISEFNNTFNSDEPVYTGEMDAKAELSVRGEFMLYGVAGVYADLGGFAKFKAAIPGDPIWKVKGGFEASVGVALDVIVWNVDFEEDLFSKNWLILEAPNQPPDPPTVSHPYPEVFGAIEKDGDVMIDISMFDPEQGENCCLVKLVSNLDGLMLRAPTYSAVSFPYVFKNEGTHIITATVQDAEGQASSNTSQVEVEDRLLAIIGTPQSTFNVPGGVFADDYADLEIIFEDTREVGPDLDCCSTAWYVDGVFIARTNNFDGDTMHHKLRHKFTWPGGVLTKAEVEVKAIADFDIANDGKPAATISRTATVTVTKNKPKIINTLSAISKSFPAAHEPPQVNEDIIYTTTLSNPDSCHNVHWYSSIESDDGVDGDADGFLGFGARTGNQVSFTRAFDTQGIRTITASISDGGCQPASVQVKTKVTNAVLGGSSPNVPVNFSLN